MCGCVCLEDKIFIGLFYYETAMSQKDIDKQCCRIGLDLFRLLFLIIINSVVETKESFYLELPFSFCFVISLCLALRYVVPFRISK